MTTKTCRYGCGDLLAEDGIWHLPAFKIDPRLKDIGVETGSMVFTVKILCCKTCGYIELSDYHVPQNDERDHP